MKGWKFLVITILIFSSGCATAKKQPGAGYIDERNRVVNLYLKAMATGRKDAVEGIKENLKLSKTFGYVQPYVPVLSAPQVRAIWCQAHKSIQDKDTLVSGHWVYVMVQGPKWFIENEETKGTIPVIVPYKESKK